jgi:hypothetical protein
VIRERHRVGAVHARSHRHRRPYLLSDDPNALEFARQEAERGRAAGIRAGRLVARYGSIEPSDQEVGAAVAIQIAELRDVLPVGKDRSASHIFQRVGREDEAIGAALSVVSVVLDVAEGLLGEEIEVAVGVHVGETVPLAHVDVAVPRSARHEPGQAVALTVTLEEGDASGHFLDEQIQITVPVRVHQLRTGRVEPALERQLHRTPGAVHHRKRRDDQSVPRARRFGCGRSGSCAAAGRRGEEEERKCHPERSEGDHIEHGPLRCARGDRWFVQGDRWH